MSVSDEIDQGFIEIGRSRTTLNFTNPLRKMNNSAFGTLSVSCSGILELMRKESLPQASAEFGKNELTDTIIT